MDNPCKHCDKADVRNDILKCDKPCNKAKQWFECEELLIEILMGKMPSIKPKGEQP